MFRSFQQLLGATTPNLNEFFDAAERGRLSDLATVQRYIAANHNHIDINATNQNGNTALILAARKGNIAIIFALLAVPGININASDNELDGDDNTALIYAARDGHITLVKALLAMPGINVNAIAGEGTALIGAARFGHTKIVRALLTVLDINIEAVDREKNNALMWAAQNGHSAIVIALLAAPGININSVNQSNHFTALIWAVIKGHTDVVTILLSTPGININAVDIFGRTTLIQAARFGHKVIVSNLLAVKGININAVDGGGKTALMHATEKGHTAIVSALTVAAHRVPIHAASSATRAKNLVTFEKFIQAAKRGDLSTAQQYIAENRNNVASINAAEQFQPDHPTSVMPFSWHEENDSHYRRTALMHAAKRNHTAIVSVLLAVPDININAVDIDGNTALILAVHRHKNNIATVSALLAMPDININAANENGSTALSKAIFFNTNNTVIVSALLAVPGININATTRSSFADTTLIWAATNGHTAIVMTLLAMPGSDVLLSNFCGDTALSLATKKGHTAIVSALKKAVSIAQAADKNIVTHAQFIEAAKRGNLSIVKKYIAANRNNVANINATDHKGCTALICAAQIGSIPITSELLAIPGINVNAASTQYGSTALICAVAGGHIAIVSALLVISGINVNAIGDGHTALMWAVIKGYLEIVSDLLVVPGINVDTIDKDGKNALMHATEHGHSDIIIALKNKNIISAEQFIKAAKTGNLNVVQKYIALNRDNTAKINVVGRFGITALMCAANNNHTAIVTTLLAVPGINVNATDADGQTALIKNIKHRSYEKTDNTTDNTIVLALLAVPGIDVNVGEGTLKETVLIFAASSGNTTLVSALLAIPGINVNRVMFGGETALMRAAMYGYSATVSALLIHPDINTNAVDEKGKTALMHAIEKNHTDIISTLKAAPSRLASSSTASGSTSAIPSTTFVPPASTSAFASAPLDPTQATPTTFAKDIPTSGQFLLAAKINNLNIIQQYIAANSNNVASINVTDIDGNTALIWAAIIGHIDIISTLLAVPNINVNADGESGNTALITAVIHGHLTIVSALLAVPNIDINATGLLGKTALTWAAFLGHTAIVHALLAVPSIDINAIKPNGKTALMHAIEKGHTDIISALKGVGALINVPSPHQASSTNILTSKQFINKTKAENLFASKIITPEEFIEAAKEGDLSTIQKYIAANQDNVANINIVTQHSYPALIWAARNNHAAIVSALVAVPGINVNVNTFDSTALIWATINGDKDAAAIVTILLTAPNININATDSTGKTVLMYAVRLNRITTVSVLLANPYIDINASDKYGKTALIWAAKFGYKRMVSNLLAVEGININAIDRSGKTALKHATKNGHMDIVFILKNAITPIEYNSSDYDSDDSEVEFKPESLSDFKFSAEVEFTPEHTSAPLAPAFPISTKLSLAPSPTISTSIFTGGASTTFVPAASTSVIASASAPAAPAALAKNTDLPSLLLLALQDIDADDAPDSDLGFNADSDDSDNEFKADAEFKPESVSNFKFSANRDFIPAHTSASLAPAFTISTKLSLASPPTVPISTFTGTASPTFVPPASTVAIASAPELPSPPDVPAIVIPAFIPAAPNALTVALASAPLAEPDDIIAPIFPAQDIVITAEQFAQAKETGDVTTVKKYLALPGTFQERLDRIGFDGTIPEDCVCPTSGYDIMNDPITVATGITFDRENLTEWCEAKGNSETFECPITRLPINKSELENETDDGIKQLIENFVKGQENLIIAETEENAEKRKKQVEESHATVSEKQFFEAARTGSLKTVEKYIAANLNNISNLNATTVDGYTALIYAAYYGHLAIVSALLTVEGINIKATDARGNTAATCAAQNGHVAIVTGILTIPGTFQEKLSRIAFNNDNIPKSFKCHISHGIINDPIHTSGVNYDRLNLRKSFADRGNPETISCFANSNKNIKRSALENRTAIIVKNQIEAFVKEEENKIIATAEKNKGVTIVPLPPVQISSSQKLVAGFSIQSRKKNCPSLQTILQ